MEAILSNFRQVSGRFSGFSGKSVGAPTLVLLILALLVVPLPAFLLDVFFTFNIMLGLLMVMITLNTRRPLEFSSFPSVLLIGTLLRLGLNVASTRVVLVEGHTGTDAAGAVIESFDANSVLSIGGEIGGPIYARHPSLFCPRKKCIKDRMIRFFVVLALPKAKKDNGFTIDL